MTETKKTVTPSGEVEYNTIECHSCGQEHVKSDCKLMFVGDLFRPDLSVGLARKKIIQK